MIYIIFGLMVGIMTLFEKLDDRREARSYESVQETHNKLYNLIDKHFGDSPAQARERKAEVDMIIHEHWKEKGREYKPTKVDEVTTRKERKERLKACENGCYSTYRAKQFEKAKVLDAIDEAIIDKMVDIEMSQPKGSKEYAITRMMERLNISRDEATRRVDNFMSTMC